MLHVICAALVGFAATTWAQSSTYTEAGIPTGTPITGSYDGLLRPQVHFSPPKGFTNDPNGLFVDAHGLHHLYYQYNPNETIAGNQHWGHATSPDLYHWTNQPIALFPDNSTQGIFTGSIVLDVNNTSGFFPNHTNGVVAVYTLNGPEQQVQELAYSRDGGYTFTKYSGNPILSADSPNFRDPKVIYHAPTSSWIMAVSYAQDYTIGIFTSTNLTSWRHASNFSHGGLLGMQYECPNLIPLPMTNASEQMYILLVSINPGAPLGGSITQYFPGTFNGTHFFAVDNVARIADFGKDNYAGQFFYGIPETENQVSIAWASNWQYCNYVPTGPEEGWQSAMTLPRMNYLQNLTRTGYDLVSQPYGLSAVMPASPTASNSSLGNGTLVADFGDGSGAVMLSLNITGLDGSALSLFASVNVTFLSSASGEMLSVAQFLGGGGGGQGFSMDRGKIAGFENPFFTDRVSTNLAFGDAFDMQIVVDRSVWEAFLLGGTQSATLTFFPEGILDTVIVRVGGVNEGARVSVEVWNLQSAWEGEEDAMGVVMGNRTTVARRNGLPLDW